MSGYQSLSYNNYYQSQSQHQRGIGDDHIRFRINSHIYVIVHGWSNCPVPIWEYNRALLKWYDGLSIIKITIDFATPITFDFFFSLHASYFLHIKHGLMSFNFYRLWLSYLLICRINKCNYNGDGWSPLDNWIIVSPTAC